MSHMEDDDPPIKSHPASKEYRDNWDATFGEKEPEEAVDPDTLEIRMGYALIESNAREGYNTVFPIPAEVVAERDRLAEACRLCDATDHESVQAFGGTITGCPEVPDGYMIALPAEPRVESAGNTQIEEPGFVEACRKAEKPWERIKTGENTEDVADAPEKRPPSEGCDVCGAQPRTWCAPTCSECPDPNREK